MIGDVSGKGLSAALIMVKAMTLIHNYAKQYSDLSKVFFEANNSLCEDNVEMLFVTCWLGKINLKTNELTYINAGHNPPLIRSGNGEYEYLDMDSGVALAAVEDLEFKTDYVQLADKGSVFLYTDGVTEANAGYEEFYGEERLKEILNKHKNDNAEVIINFIDEDIQNFCNYEEQFDDTTMFIIKVR